MLLNFSIVVIVALVIVIILLLFALFNEKHSYCDSYDCEDDCDSCENSVDCDFYQEYLEYKKVEDREMGKTGDAEDGVQLSLFDTK